MNNIGGLLQKIFTPIYQKKIEEEKLSNIVKKCFFEKVGDSFGEDFFEIRNKIIYLKCDPLLKNEIFFSKSEIVRKINKQFGKIIIEDMK